MEFTYPQYLWLLTGIPLALILWGVGLWHHRRMRARFGNLTNLEEISRVSWAGKGWLRGGLFAVSLTAMILALTHPQMLGRDVRPVPKATDVVFMLDISPSMFARDMDPHRLGRAEQIVQRFFQYKQPDDRYAVVGFNYNSIILSYLTRDPQGILLYFDYLNRTTEPAVGTNMGAALVSAMRVIDADDQIVPANRERRRVLVLLSDGDDTIGEWEVPLGEVASRRIKVYTFGLGTATGAFFPLELSTRGEVVRWAISDTGQRLTSKAQTKTLREIAERTGARFFRAEDDRQVQAAIDEILTTSRPIGGYQAYAVRRDLHFHFLAAAFVCMLAAVFL